MAKYSVKQGDDIDSIAFDHGFNPDTIWEHEENAGLREQRSDPAVLMEGDEVFIPDKVSREEKVMPGKRHTFYRKGVPASMSIQFQNEGEPRANVPYIFKIVTACETKYPDVESKTDAQGYLIEAIPPNTTSGEIILDPGSDGEEYIPFTLGRINPANEGVDGIQSMLKNMNYYFGDIDNTLGELTIAAIREFQIQVMDLKTSELLPLDATEVDQATLDAIEKAYSA